MASGIAGVLCVLWIAFMPQWEELYVRRVVVPHLELRYGFRVATLTFSRDGNSWDADGIVDIRRGTELDRLGVRNGDVPIAYHGGGWVFFASALVAYERNRLAEFEVVNVTDWNAGLDRRAFRTIQLGR